MADDLSGLDQAISQAQGTPAPASPGAAGLDDAIAQVRGQQRDAAATAVRNNLQFAAGANADEEAKYRHLARFTGQPLESVRADPQRARVAAVLQATDADRIAADHPATAAALGDASTARLLHDDIPTTAKTESLVSRLGALRDYVFGAGTGPSMAGDLYRSVIGGLSVPAKYVNLAGGVVPIGLDALKGAATGTPTTEYEDPYFAAAVAPADRNIGAAKLPEQVPIERRATAAVGQLAAMLAEAFATGGTAEAPAVVPPMREFLTNALAHATRAMSIPASSHGMQTGEDVLNATGDAGDAVKAGLAQYLVDTAQGVLPASVQGGLLKRAGTGAANAVVTGQAGRMAMNEVMPESMRQPFDPEGAISDAIIGAGLGAAIGPRAAPEWHAAVRRTYAEAAQNEATTHAANLLTELGQTISEGKFRERDQEAFRDFIGDMHGPDLYVDGRQLAGALDQSGLTGEQLQQALPGVAEQMREALQSDGMVRVPMADYAAHIAGGAADAALQPHLRLDPNGPTFAEAQASQGKEAQRLTEAANGLLNEPETEKAAAFRASSDEVHKQVLESLTSANRFPADVNRQYAELVRAYYDTTAQRTGALPTDLFQAFPLGVRQEGAGNLGVRQENGEVMQAQADRQPRASYDTETGTVILRKDADLSSFLHEAGHHFLETHARIAMDPNAPESLRKDVEAIVGDPAAWLAKSLNERRDTHENFARSFEQYLMEGKAPAANLRGLFQRFRAWLVQVYRSLAGTRGALSDDLRQVMDRMLASDDAIREQEAVRGMSALFPVKPEGMSDEAFAGYRALGKQATEHASAKLSDASLRDLKWLSNAKGRAVKALQAQAREARDAIREEVTKEVDETPAFQAKAFMHENRGTDPDIAAERFGFSSGDEMAQAIADAGDRKDVIQAMTDQRMLQRHGELTDPVSVERMAEEAIHNQARARFIATELNALARSTGSPALLARAARSAAEAAVAAKRVRDLRPDQYTAAEGRAAREAQAAFKKGDVPMAAVKKRAQLLSNAMAREALDARTEVAQGVAYLKKFDKASIRENLGPEFLAQIDALRERYDLRQATGNKIDQRATLRAFVQARLNAGEATIPARAEALLSPKERAAFEALIQSRDADGNLVYAEPAEQDKLLAEALDRSERMPYQQMTVEAFRGLRDTVKTLEHLARQEGKMLTAEAERSYREVRDEMAGSIAEHATASGKGDRSAATVLGRALQGIRAFGAAHIKVATWARIMDGGEDNGAVWRYLVMPANKAATFETGRRAEATQALSAIWRPVLKDVSFRDRAGSGRFFPELDTSLNWQERMAMALNYGNEGNLQRLLGGGIAAKRERLTMPQVQAVLKTLTAAEWRAVQATWDHLETYRPEVGALERRMSGVEPNWVEARPFKVTTADGQNLSLKGGYYPIMYDPRGSLKAQQHADAADAKAMLKGAYSQAATQHGFTKNRVEEVNGRPLMLRWDSLYRGVNDVIHDLAWREWVRDANKLMRSKTIDAQIRDHYGPEVKREFEKWRDDIVAGARRLDSKVETAAGVLRQGVAASGLTFNVMSAAMQPLGLTQSFARVGAGPMARGLAKYIGSPIDATREANAKSAWMANRMRTRFRELNELRNAVQGQTAGKELLGRYGYWLMMRAQQMVDVPTWHGAYEKAIAEGHGDDTAVHLADQAVKDAQGGGEEVDQAGIERGGPLVKLFTTFYGFMNTAANMGYLSLKTQRSAAVKAAHLLLLYSVPAVLGALVKDALTPGDSGNWDEDHIAKKLAQEQASYLLGLVVFGREFSGLVSGQDYSGPAGVRLIPDTAKLVTQAKQGDFDDAFRKALVNELGDLMGLPGAQINRTITGTEALSDGETDNPAAVLFGYQQPH
jgi:hypothetical protein